jgi:hypothetical protein
MLAPLQQLHNDPFEVVMVDSGHQQRRGSHSFSPRIGDHPRFRYVVEPSWRSVFHVLNDWSRAEGIPGSTCRCSSLRCEA